MESARPGVPGEWFQFAVESKETGDLVGDCAMQVDGQEPYLAEIGFTLAREHQGKGFASEAVSRLLDYAFDDLGLHRVATIADSRNKPSWALLERVGVLREGHFLENVWFKGRWSDEYLYALLKDEWLRKRTYNFHGVGRRRRTRSVSPKDAFAPGSKRPRVRPHHQGVLKRDAGLG